MPQKLTRFLPVYGGKRSLATRYSPPKHPLIIEPFAGGAGYSLEHYDGHMVHLYDLDERVCEVWKFLIEATADEILGIPTDIENVEELSEFGQGVKWLVGWWFAPANSGGPRPKRYDWGKNRNDATEDYANNVWSKACRDRIAQQVHQIDHWTIKHLSYVDIVENPEATWFVDPPYQVMKGRHYRKGSQKIDYKHLGQWCHERSGQVIVCENQDANWLNFQLLNNKPARTVYNDAGTGRRVIPKREVVWER